MNTWLQGCFDEVRRWVVCKDPDLKPIVLFYIDRGFRPSWMSETQWSQYVAFCRGEAIPTDPELIAGLSHDPEVRERMRRWIHTSVSTAVTGSNYSKWCQCIDNSFDIGL